MPARLGETNCALALVGALAESEHTSATAVRVHARRAPNIVGAK
jgi:hypothetical protein